jgi:RNA polymerase sigma factor (sigma-70 family)
MEPKPISAPPMSLPGALGRLATTRDARAWEALLYHSGEDILRISRRILGDAALAEDACQETLLQIRAHAGVFKAPADPKEAQQAARVWVMRIATNISLRMGRGRIRSQKREELGAKQALKMDVNCPESKSLRGEQAEILKREVADLPETLREPILLRFYAEMDYPELGRALDCSPDAAKKRVQRGLERLRVRLALLGLALTFGDLSTQLFGNASAHAAEAGGAIGAAGVAGAAAAGTAAGAGGMNATLQLAWGGLLNSSSVPALASAIPAGGLSLMAKISLGVAALVLVGTSVAVVQHSKAAEKQPAPTVAAPAKETPAKPAAQPAATAPAAPAKPAAAEDKTVAAVREKLKKKITFEFVAVPITDAVAFLAQISNVNLVMSPKLDFQNNVPAITLNVKDVEMEVALRSMTKLVGLDFDVQAGGVLIDRPESISTLRARQQMIQAQNDAAAQAALDVRAVPWKKALLDKMQTKVTFEFKETPLTDAIAMMRGITGVNFVLDPKVAKESTLISLRVTDMKAELAMDWIAKLANVEFELKDDAVVFRKADPAGAEAVNPTAVKPPAPPEF